MQGRNVLGIYNQATLVLCDVHFLMDDTLVLGNANLLYAMQTYSMQGKLVS